MVTDLNYPIKKQMYIMILINSWYLGGEDINISIMKIKIVDIEITTAKYGSSGSFGSRVRSKPIGHKTYTGRRRSLW